MTAEHVDRVEGAHVIHRAIEIQTGYGLEGDLPDALLKRIINNYMLPAFRERDWDRGMTEGVAAIAGVLLCSFNTSLMPTTGSMPGIKAFTAAVFGGIGSIPGAVIGAFIIGICETLIKGTSMTVFSDAFTFALLIVVLVVKPTGLFGEKATDKV